METNINTPESTGTPLEERDPELWKMAQRRAAFKYHVLIYFIVNLFLWTLWYINLQNGIDRPLDERVIPWPVWPMFGWGIGLLFHYTSAYRNKNALAEKEYERLKKNKY